MWNREQHEQEFRDPEQETVPGVIETIGLGYSRLVEYPAVVLVPVLLDLYLWLGVKISAEPLSARLMDWFGGIGESSGSIAGLLLSWNELNVLELSSFRLPVVRLPTIVPLTSGDVTLSLSSVSPNLTALPWWTILILAALSVAAGFLIGAEYLSWLSSTTAGTVHRFSIRNLLGIARAMASWILLLAALLLLVTGPLIIAQIAFSFAGFGTSWIITMLMLVPAIWGFVAFFFSIYAIVVDRLGALASLRASYQVVRRYLWQSLGFIAAYFLVVNAFPLIWQQILAEPAGTIIAIVGHAFIASGMIAAAIIFYRDRARRIGLPSLVSER